MSNYRRRKKFYNHINRREDLYSVPRDDEFVYDQISDLKSKCDLALYDALVWSNHDEFEIKVRMTGDMVNGLLDVISELACWLDEESCNTVHEWISSYREIAKGVRFWNVKETDEE